MKRQPLKQRLIRLHSRPLPQRILSFFIPHPSETSLKERVQIVPKRNHWTRVNEEEG